MLGGDWVDENILWEQRYQDLCNTVILHSGRLGKNMCTSWFVVEAYRDRLSLKHASFSEFRLGQEHDMLKQENELS